MAYKTKKISGKYLITIRNKLSTEIKKRGKKEIPIQIMKPAIQPIFSYLYRTKSMYSEKGIAKTEIRKRLTIARFMLNMKRKQIPKIVADIALLLNK